MQWSSTVSAGRRAACLYTTDQTGSSKEIIQLVIKCSGTPKHLGIPISWRKMMKWNIHHHFTCIPLLCLSPALLLPGGSAWGDGSALMPRSGPAFTQTLKTFKLTLQKKIKLFYKAYIKLHIIFQGFYTFVSQCKAANTRNIRFACPHSLPTTTSSNKCKNQKEGDANVCLIVCTRRNKCIGLT